MQHKLLTTDSQLAELCQRAKELETISLDTEFLWERTFYPKLGLIQLALSDEECYLLDPLEILDLRPLGELLANPFIIKIFHDAPQDLAILARATGATPCNIFDTRLAAGFAEMPATLSLGNLVKSLLEIELDKSATRTNWLKRPLSNKQILYAENDVRYLQAVRVILLSKIGSSKIQKWLDEELKDFDSPASYDLFNPSKRYKRIKGYQRLDTAGLAVLINLADWREEQAKEQDKPRGHIVGDAVLLEIARSRPENTEALQKSSISDKALKKYGSALLKLITESPESPETEPAKIIKKPTKQEKILLDNLHKYITLKSDLLGIDPHLIGNSNELKEMIHFAVKRAGLQNLRQGTGWRWEFLAEFFQKKL